MHIELLCLLEWCKSIHKFIHEAHISEHVSMKAQGEVGALIADDPNMQARLQSDPQGAQVGN